MTDRVLVLSLAEGLGDDGVRVSLRRAISRQYGVH